MTLLAGVGEGSPNRAAIVRQRALETMRAQPGWLGLSLIAPATSKFIWHTAVLDQAEMPMTRAPRFVRRAFEEKTLRLL